MPVAVPEEVLTTAADIICRGHELYVTRFAELTRLARVHFERREWTSAQRDQIRRLDIYSETRQLTVDELKALWPVDAQRAMIIADLPAENNRASVHLTTATERRRYEHTTPTNLQNESRLPTSRILHRILAGEVCESNEPMTR